MDTGNPQSQGIHGTSVEAFLPQISVRRQRLLCFFLISAIGICLYLGMKFQHGRDQEKSVSVAEKAYGLVMYDYHQDQNGRFNDQAAQPPVTLVSRGLGFHAVHSVIFLDLDSDQVTDETMAGLTGFRDLKVLHISNTSITDEGLAVVSKFPALRILTLNADGLSENALKYVAISSALEELEVHNFKITDIGVMQLSQMQNLRRLYLEGTDISNLGIEKLRAAMPKCEIDLYPE